MGRLRVVGISWKEEGVLVAGRNRIRRAELAEDMST